MEEPSKEREREKERESGEERETMDFLRRVVLKKKHEAVHAMATCRG